MCARRAAAACSYLHPLIDLRERIARTPLRLHILRLLRKAQVLLIMSQSLLKVLRVRQALMRLPEVILGLRLFGRVAARA